MTQVRLSRVSKTRTVAQEFRVSDAVITPAVHEGIKWFCSDSKKLYERNKLF